MKVCNKCKIAKSDAESHKRNSAKDGLSYRCKQCVSEDAKERMKSPEAKERARKYKIKYRSEPENLKRIKEQGKKHYKEYMQRPEVKEHKKLYRKEYGARPEVKERRKKYHKELCSNSDVRNQRREYAREYRGKPEIKARTKEYDKERYLHNSKKIEAHRAVKIALKSGALFRLDKCQKCQDIKFTEAHHPDYNKPLQVEWLCRSCHRQWHAEHGEGLNSYDGQS